jgi:hypothetical protein
MSVVPGNIVYTPNTTVGGNDTALVVWGPSAAWQLPSVPPLTFATLDSGQPMQLPSWADCSFQVVGTFGAGGNIVIEGSNDGNSYGPLNDPFGVSLNFTNDAPRQATERCQFVRPRVTAGDGRR